MTLSCAAICKNEQHNVVGFLDNLRQHGVENLYITDTGSTDSTVEFIMQNWDPEKLHLSTVAIEPFDFAAAKNTNIGKVLREEQWIIHLDLDERIVSLPHTMIENTVYHCCRREMLWGTVSFNIARITPAHDWWWEYPIHEFLRYNISSYATVEQSSNFIIEHHQKPDKDFYTQLTKEWFEQDVRRLFYHRMCDLMREEQWQECVDTFLKYYSEVESTMTDQQRWQTIRNYQISRIKCRMQPDAQYLYIFHKCVSQSSMYYLSFFHYYMGNESLARDYARTAEHCVDSASNTVFYNKNIKGYVSKLLNL